MSYPPDEHVLRDLALEVESRPDGTASGWLSVTAPMLAPGGGVDIGALAMLVDVLGGGLTIRSVHPDWSATADLALRLLGTVCAGDGDVVQADVAVVRKGRTTLVSEVALSCGGEPLGWGSMTFAVLPRRADTLAFPPPTDEVVRTRFGGDGSGFRVPILDAVGATVVGPGVARLAWSPYVRNSMGAVQGGVVALLGGLAGRSAFDHAPVRDLHVAYLAQAREGPVVARAEVLARDAATVRITDGERLAAVVHVGAAA